MRNGRGAQAGFVGEHASGDPEANGRGDRGTGEPAGGCGGRECVREDQAEGRRDIDDVDQNDDERGADVEHHHGRYQLAGDLADPPDAADQDDADEGRNDNAGYPRRD